MGRGLESALLIVSTAAITSRRSAKHYQIFPTVLSLFPFYRREKSRHQKVWFAAQDHVASD